MTGHYFGKVMIWKKKSDLTLLICFQIWPQIYNMNVHINYGQ